MQCLRLRAYFELIIFDFYLRRRDFSLLHAKVRACRLRPGTTTLETVGQICRAMDEACIWYWKEVLCLQRSAATTCLLRKNGVPAQMVIGTSQIPFRAHAWVELGGQVVNDKPYIAEIYSVLDRC